MTVPAEAEEPATLTKPLRKFPIFTFDEFLAFYESRPDGERWELIDGHPVMMAPPAVRHQLIIGNLFLFLETAARGRSTGWMTLINPGLFNPDRPESATIPDVAVRPAAPYEGSYHSDAIVLMEVLSPGTKRRDRFWKKVYYQQLLTLRHYALIHQDQVRVEVITRGEPWSERVFDKPEDEVPFSAIDVRMPMREIYYRTGLV